MKPFYFFPLLLLSLPLIASEPPKDPLTRPTFSLQLGSKDWTYNGKATPFMKGKRKEGYSSRNILSFSLSIDEEVNRRKLQALTGREWKNGDRIQFMVYLLAKSIGTLGEDFKLPLPKEGSNSIFLKGELSLRDIDNLKLQAKLARIESLQKLIDEYSLNVSVPETPQKFDSKATPEDRQKVLAELRTIRKNLSLPVFEYEEQLKLYNKDKETEEKLRTQIKDASSKLESLGFADAPSQEYSINSSDDEEDRKTTLASLEKKFAILENKLDDLKCLMEGIEKDNKAQESAVSRLQILKEKLAIAGVVVEENPSYTAYMKESAEEQRKARNRELLDLESRWKVRLAQAEAENQAVNTDGRELLKKAYRLGQARGKLEKLLHVIPDSIPGFFGPKASSEERKALLSSYDNLIQESEKKIQESSKRTPIIKEKNRELKALQDKLSTLKQDLESRGIESGAYKLPNKFHCGNTDEEIAAALSGIESQIEALTQRLTEKSKAAEEGK